MSIYSGCNLLFPQDAIPELKLERGQEWQKLVSAVEQTEPDSLEATALVLLLARLNGCASCNSDSYRAINGCIGCARQSLRRYRGMDAELLAQYNAARLELAPSQAG
jgi:alkylhydroperoxidase family enzyme